MNTDRPHRRTPRALRARLLAGLPGGSRPWLLPLLIVAAVAISYASSLRGPFLFDDFTLHLSTALTKRPLSALTFRIDRALAPTEPLTDHLWNVGIHILAALLLYGIVGRTLERVASASPSSTRAALAFSVALLWSIHPLQTESVAYIAQRAESMAGLFYLGALYGLTRFAAGEGGSRWGWLALLSFALGMASKETAATAPLLLLLYDRTFVGGSFAGALRLRWRFYLALAIGWVLLFGALVSWQLVEEKSGMGFRLTSIGPLEYARTQPAVILHYLRLAFWPHPLCLDYMWPPADSPGDYLRQTCLVAALVAGTVLAIVRRSWLGFLGAWFFVILAPTSSFMPLEDLAFEHRMYLPLSAVVVLVVVGAWRLAQGIAPGAPALPVALGAATLALMATTIERNRDYRSELSMWRSVVARAPHNLRAYCNLGGALTDAGRPEEAIEVLRQGLAVGRDFGTGNMRARSYCNLGAALSDAGRPAEAIEPLQESLALLGEDGAIDVRAKAHCNLGAALLGSGRFAEAIEALETSIELCQAYGDEQLREIASYNLAWALATQPVSPR